MNKTAPRVEYETPYKMIRTPNIKGGKISRDDCRFVTEDTYEKWTRRAKVLRNDVLLTREAPMGEVGIVDFDDTVFLGQRIMQYRADKSKIDPHFLLYSFLSKDLQHQFNMHEGSGSVVSHIRVPDCSKFELNLPPLRIQKEISNVLKQIDRKISVNTQTNQTLEDMAQAIFKSWFVDFDPVTAKMNGEQTEGMDKATASLFPEKLVESDLGLIPEGWEIKVTQDLFEVKDGTHDSPKKAEEGHYLVTSKHITKGKIDTSSAYLISDDDFEKVNLRSKVDTLDILLTMIGTVGEVVVVHDDPVEFAIKNVGLFKTSQRPDLVWLFFWHLQSYKMKHYLEVRMAGTTQQYLTLKTLRTIPVLLPPKELLDKFNGLMTPLMEKISENHNQNETLSGVRDTLLPKLLSGEIELAQNDELTEVS
ncbi:restriction endonuclease subunit S [Vibrio sp. JC009]|nr:restriction endonuclease subunit S [Vibrio sp. JC009]